MNDGPGLFVVCKSCGAEVSPYITECPYCGSRLRKRAPKLDKPGATKPAKPPRRTRRTRETGRFSYGVPREPRIHTGRPWATIVLVLVAVLTTVTTRGALFSISELSVLEPITPDVADEPWRAATTLFVFGNTGYEAVVLSLVFLFGWLIERRHGGWATVLVFLLAGSAGTAAASFAEETVVVLGAGAAALGLLAAWAVRPLRDARSGRSDPDDAPDWLGVGVMALVLLALPLATQEASLVAATAGGLAGLVLGLVLSALPERR